MATATKIVLHLVLLLWGEVHVVQSSALERQRNGFIVADVGDTVTLNCSVRDYFRSYYWYKQSPGAMPEPLAFRNKYSDEATVYEKFNDSRFSVVVGEEQGEDRLRISSVRASDSAVYYCLMQMFQFDVQFRERVALHVRGSSSPNAVRTIVRRRGQPAPGRRSPLRPGDSVTLNCTVVLHTTAGADDDYAEASCGETAVLQGGDSGDLGEEEGEEGDCRRQMKVLAFLSVGRTGVVLCLVLVCTVVYMARKYTCQCHVEER